MNIDDGEGVLGGALIYAVHVHSGIIIQSPAKFKKDSVSKLSLLLITSR